MRNKVIDEIVRKIGRNWSSVDTLKVALKYLSDTQLIAAAIELEIDTDAIFAEVK